MAREHGEQLPVSFAQQRLWFVQRLDPQSAAYLMPGGYRLQGAVDVRALEESVREVVRRHGTLRTTFQEQDGLPVQLIQEAFDYHLPIVALDGLMPEQFGQELQHLIAQEERQPCDLEQGPLFRVTLLRRRANEHILLLTLHHIISDGWSMSVLMYELATLYKAYSTGQSSPLPPLSIQYADYALWQRQWLQGRVLTRYLDYWKRQLAGATALLLPADHPRSPSQGLRGAALPFQLPADLVAQVQRLSQEERVTPFMTLLAAFQILLSRLSGQTDVVVGTDIANRRHLETEPLIGFFVNLLALRLELRGGPVFRTLLHQVLEMVLGAYAHQDLPFEMLVEHLRLARNNRSRTQLINILFVMQNMPRANEGLSELIIEPVQSEVATSKFDLALFLREGPR
ncbi:MAG: condensation domain-containing protein, partial [Ktedonobacteraceae bacterium]